MQFSWWVIIGEVMGLKKKKKKKKSEIYWKLSNSCAKQVWLNLDDLHLVSSYLNGLDLWPKAWICKIWVFFNFKLNFDPLPIEISS